MPYERRDKMTFSLIVDLVLMAVKIIIVIVETILSRKNQRALA
jgi:hypothetical protein